MIVPIVAALAIVAQAEPAPPSTSQPPDPAEAIAKTWLMDQLIDPESARIKLIFGPTQMAFKKTFVLKVEGVVVCYDVNAKNGFGGFAGNDRKLIVVRDGKIVYSVSEQYPDGFTAFDVVSKVCGATGRSQRQYFTPIEPTRATRTQ